MFLRMRYLYVPLCFYVSFFVCRLCISCVKGKFLIHRALRKDLRGRLDRRSGGGKKEVKRVRSDAS